MRVMLLFRLRLWASYSRPGNEFSVTIIDQYEKYCNGLLVYGDGMFNKAERGELNVTK
jgi:hypothetical protein